MDDVLGLYADIFGLTEEQAADHLRDRGRLDSVLVRPKQYATYGGADISLQSAVLCHGIAEGQPFVDGNKRTAAISLIAFLRYNGFDLHCSKAELAQWILDLSSGMTAEELAERIRGVLIERPIGV
jgi:death-on-curing protein